MFFEFVLMSFITMAMVYMLRAGHIISQKFAAPVAISLATVLALGYGLRPPWAETEHVFGSLAAGLLLGLATCGAYSLGKSLIGLASTFTDTISKLKS